MFNNFPVLKGFFLSFFLLTSNLLLSQTYCSSSAYNAYGGYDDDIRLVNFNSINNATPDYQSGYSDFTSISTNVVINSSYNLSVYINTGGNYRYEVWVWIDWNQDGDFNDSGENYDLGSATNVLYAQPSSSPYSVTVPNTAVLGTTRMRVTSRWNNNPSSCQNNFDGEVEDYTINVIANNTITTGTISPTSYCAGTSVSIPYTKTGTFTAGNIFTAQLSNATGSFAAPINIGTLNSTAAGTISATIPFGTSYGTGYRIRVISSNPSVTGTNNGVDLTVNSAPTAPIIGIITQPNCTTATGSVTLSGLPSSWELTRSPGAITTTGSGTSTIISGLSPGSYTYTVKNNVTGLNAEYFNNMTLSGSPALTRIDNSINFNWGTGNPGSPIGNDNFSVRWTGVVQPLVSDSYIFRTNSDDGIRLWVNGTLVINNWTNHGPTNDYSIPIALIAGQKYNIILEFYENGGGAVAQLDWNRSLSTTYVNIPQSQLFPSAGCSSPSSANVVINAQPTVPSAPSATGEQICIGSTATLSASGAVLGDRYRWYNAATAGTLLYTSTNNADYTYTTPTISATTNYWVSILNSGGCESSRTMVTATYPTNSPDSQTTLGTDSWIGHVYDGTNSGVAFNGSFTNYYGNVTQSETFDETFGGNTTCFALNSTLGSRSIFTETFSVRYRMNSTKKGFYVVDLGSDDGSRLQVDGTLVYNNWSDQGFSTRSGVLMSLNGNSSLVYDFYENGGGNRVIFNNLIKVLDNTLSANTIQSICNTSTGLAISGDTFGTLPTGISLSGTGYQWAYSTSATGPWTNISGATSATFTPSGLTPEFSAGGTFYVIRKAILSSINNINPNPYVATNNSNVATITIITNNSWSGAVSADWNNAANWSCGAVPTITTDVIIPSGTLHDPIIYISPDANGLVKNIELQSGATLTIQDNYIQIAGMLLLNGVIDLVGEGQLIQTTGSLLDNSSTGYIERDQQGQGSRYRYNDWSSPVIKTGTSLGTPFSIADVLRDGTVSSTPGLIIYTSGYDGATSPFTLSEFWMYKYANAPDGSYSDWDKIGSTGTLSPGEGFLMKGTGNPGSPDQNYVFVGKPNNGAISFTVNPNYDYLVGNPYPSAIDLNKFIDDNTPSGTGSSITGSIYFWDHYGGTTHNLADYQAGYGIYTKGGGVKASAHSSVSGTGTSVKVPTRYLPIGQGFFVVGDSDGGAIQFNNSQRIFVTETSGNSIFMKGAISKSSEVLKVSADDLRPKFRLGFTGPKIDHRQILLTLDPDTTDGLDWGFEAEPYEIFEDDMYWIISDKKYVIQATNSINIDKEIPLGVKTAGGLIKIEIDLLENVNPSTNLYIKDNSTGQTFDIKQQDFEITLPAGEYNSRFSLVFKAQNTLAVEDEILNEGIIVFMNNASSELVIRKSISNAIESVQLFNRLGQLIKTWNNSFKGEEFNLPINESTGLYFVKINTDIGKINKKIIIE